MRKQRSQGVVLQGTASTSVSVEGTIAVTLNGAGLSQRLHKNILVTVGGVTCTVTSTSTSSVTCTLGAANRTRVKPPILSQFYTMRTGGTQNVVVKVNGTAWNLDNNVVKVTFDQTVTPTITTVTPTTSRRQTSGTVVAPGSRITVVGTRFAASGNRVVLEKLGIDTTTTNCTVVSESTTQIVCEIASPATSYGTHIVGVIVPSVGRAHTGRSCAAGEYLMCDGNCIKDV